MPYPISRYLNTRQAYYPTFFDDDRRIAFLTDVTGVPQAWQTSVPADQHDPAWPDQLTWEADRVLGLWSSPGPGDARLIYARDSGGNENAQLFLLHPDTADETALTAGYDEAMHTFGCWSQDGADIVFSANRRDPGLFDLYVQPLDGPARMVFQSDSPGYLLHPVFSPDARRISVVQASTSFQHCLWEIELASGERRKLSPEGAEVRYEAIWYTADGRSLYANTDHDSDFLYVARIDLETLDVTPLVQAQWDVELLTCSPDASRLAYAINQDGERKLEMFDVETGQRRPAPTVGRSPGVVAWLDSRLAFGRAASMLAFSCTTATQASDIYIWDWNADTTRRVTRASHGGLPTEQFVAPTLIRYPTFDGREIPAWFFRPVQAKDRLAPVVVLVHGGPESQFVPFFHFLAQYFISSGYAVLAPNVRGSTGYGKVYSHLDDVRKRMDSVADLARAALWLKAQPGIDGDRLAVYGGSYGGFMVLATLTTNPELWAAGVEIVGIGNLVTFLENTSAYRRAAREAEYGSLEHDREWMESIAPINHLDKLTAPLMVIHGRNDPRVPFSEAERIVQSLAERGVPVEFLPFDDEGHGIVKLKNKLVAYPKVVEFLNRHLQA